MRDDSRSVMLPSSREVPLFWDDSYMEGIGSTGAPVYVEAHQDDTVIVSCDMDLLVSYNRSGPWIRLEAGTHVFDNGHPFSHQVYLTWNLPTGILEPPSEENRVTFMVTHRIRRN